MRLRPFRLRAQEDYCCVLRALGLMVSAWAGFHPEMRRVLRRKRSALARTCLCTRAGWAHGWSERHGTARPTAWLRVQGVLRRCFPW